MALQLLRRTCCAFSRPQYRPALNALRHRSSATDAPNDSIVTTVESRYSPGCFEDALSKTSFVRAGIIKGRLVRAKVVAMNDTHMKLNLGTKFFSYIPIPGQSSMFKRGDTVVVRVYTTDFTQHVAGDSKAISLFMGDVRFSHQVTAKPATSAAGGMRRPAPGKGRQF